MTNLCQNVPGELGNTKQTLPCNPARHWIFTLNNYTKDDITEIYKKLCQCSKKFVFQEEIGEKKGTPHLQGAVSFINKLRPLSLHLNRKIHWEGKGEFSTYEQMFFYCYNPIKRAGRCYMKNYKPPEVPYTLDMVHHKWHKDALKILTSKPDFRKIYWYWEQDGNFKKSLFVKWCVVNLERCIVLNGNAKDMMNAIVMYKKNTNQLPRIILVDLPRSFKTEYLSFPGLEKIKDMCFYSGKYEGGMIVGPRPHLMIFSNEAPDVTKYSIDKWNVTNLKKKDMSVFNVI